MPRFSRNQHQQSVTTCKTEERRNKPKGFYSNTKLAALFLLCAGTAYLSDTYRHRPLLLKELQHGNIAALWQRAPTATSSPDPLRRPVEDYAAEVHSYFEQENFAVLEKLVAQLRINKQRLTGGGWKLTAFYQGLRPQSAENMDTTSWRANLSRLGKWAKQYPDSATPLIAMVDNFAHLAEPIKTKAELSSLAISKRQLLKEGVELGKDALEHKADSQTKDPHLYAALLELGKLGNWDKTKFNQLYEAGVAIEPTYQPLHQAKATYLLPTWYGRLGESEEFTQQLAEKVGGQTGEQLYFLVASHLTTQVPDNAKDQVKFSLGSLKEGFRSLEARYGVDTKILNEQSRILIQQGDLAGAQELFNRIGSHYDASVWRGKNEFELAQANAAQACEKDLGALGNFNILLLGAYGASLLLARSYLGNLAGPLTNLLTISTLTGVTANFNQQEHLDEVVKFTKQTFEALAEIIERANH